MKILTAAVSLISFVQCTHKSPPTRPDNPYGLPNVGEWGMGCLINGRPWLSTHADLQAQISSDSIVEVSGMTSSAYYDNILIGFSVGVNEPLGTAIPVDTMRNYILYLTDSTCQGFQRNGVSSFAIQGTVTLLNFNRSLHEVTGTFEGIIPIPNCDTFHITDGRFTTSY